jgi:hypothetical protein
VGIEMKKRGLATESKINESQKLFSLNLSPIGKAKYSIDWSDGKSKNKDGSPQIGIFTFKNKNDLQTKISNLKSDGYKMVNNVFNALHKENVNESFTPKDIEMIKKVVDKEKRLIGLSPIFKKMGWHTDFVMMDSVPPHLKLKKKKNDKATYLLVNKKYVDKPDWVSGEIAGGLDESKNSDCKTCGKTINEADDSGLKYSKNGFVHTALAANGKRAKEVTVDGMVYRYNPVYKTYNSVKGNELLSKYTISSAKTITRS